MRNKRLWINPALTTLAVVLVIANVQVTTALSWWQWHWHLSKDLLGPNDGPLGVYLFGSHTAQAKAALHDWDSHSDVNFTYPGSHTHMSVFGANSGATGWGGLATIESYSYDTWHYWNYSRVEHCHAQFNAYYGSTDPAWAQGVFCQEVGHCLGLAHSNDGCMGLGYYNNITTTVPHNWSDINARF